MSSDKRCEVCGMYSCQHKAPFQVKCIDDKGTFGTLKVGKVYTVIDMNADFYEIKELNSGISWYKTRFVEVKDRQLLGYRVKTNKQDKCIDIGCNAMHCHDKIDVWYVKPSSLYHGFVGASPDKPAPVGHAVALRVLAAWVDCGHDGKLVKVYKK